jgi:hypothetical protein
MRKLIWTGSRLSMDEADGAWKEPFPYAKDKPGLWLSRGAGATPTCMGFGPDEDHLVVLSDAGDPVKIVAFWRDTIPVDAPAVPGAPSPRTAAAVAIDFPVATTIEWSAQACGDGRADVRVRLSGPAVLPGAQTHAMQTTLASMGYTRKGPRGAQRFRWNATTTTLEPSWLYTERSMAWTLSPVSITDQIIYLNTLQDGVMTIIGLDWDSGRPVTSIRLPATYKVNTAGQFIYPLPDGSLIVSGSFGPSRIARR